MSKFRTRLLGVSLVGFLAITLSAAVAGAAPIGSNNVALLVTGQTVVAPEALERLARDHYVAMEAALRQAGWDVRVVHAPGGDLRRDAALIGDVVRAESQSGAGSIAVITHSASTWSARYFLKNLGGHSLVDTYVAMGSAQYGSPGGCLQPPGLGWDSCPLSDFIAELNAGDDTAGATRYVGIHDDLADGRLDGGQCRIRSIPGITHTTMTADPRVIDAVVRSVDGHCDGVFADDPDGSIQVLGTLFPNSR